MIYTYKARDEAGKLIRGSMNVSSSDELLTKLHKMGYMVTQVANLKSRIGFANITFKLQSVKAQDLVVFNFQLANMLESGIPILTCLQTIADQTQNKKLKDIIKDIQKNVEAGDSFSASLRNHPDVFGPLFISMVKAGEESGKLNDVLKRYAIFSEQQHELKEKVKGALFYPVILLIASIFVILFIVTSIIPKFVTMFSKVGVKLPFSTQVLYSVGLIIKNYWYIIFIFLGFLILLTKKYLRSKKGKLNFDRLLLKIPIIGKLALKIFISIFSRTLATLSISGVPILQSLDIVREVVGNTVVSEAVVGIRESVEQGQKIVDGLKKSDEFPADVVQMIAIGEETGRLDDMLNKIADCYDMAVSYTIKRLTVLIEPAFLVIMGCIIAFIMASLLIPIFDMAKILRR